MGFLDRILGTSRPSPQQPPRAMPPREDQAIERYRYMLQTAPPETIEQAHKEAFEKLTPQQREQVLNAIAQAAPPGENAAILAMPLNDTQSMARAATRAEIRQPGVMERTLGGTGMGLGANLLTSFAMGFVGSMVANSFFSALSGLGDGAASDTDNADESVAQNDSSDEDTAYDDDDADFGGDDFEV